jgi:shikimate kinase
LKPLRPAEFRYDLAMRIFLIGPMGSGKTAVGRAVARLLHLRFIDSDAEIEARTGVDIPFIFEKEGEDGFRAREREVIADLSLQDKVVLATGGGAILAEASRRLLAERGFVVYLEASIERQLERTRTGRHRPLLNTADPRARLTELMAQREPLYRSIAQLVVGTDGRRVPLVAEAIVAAVAPGTAPAASAAAGETAVQQRSDSGENAGLT